MRWEIDNPPKVENVNCYDQFYKLNSIGKMAQIYHVPSTSKWYILLYPLNKDGSVNLEEFTTLCKVSSREKALIVLEVLEFEGNF